jgi:hypothetical protein
MLNGKCMYYVSSVQASLANADSNLDFRLHRLILQLSADEVSSHFYLPDVAARIHIVRAAEHAGAPTR